MSRQNNSSEPHLHGNHTSDFVMVVSYFVQGGSLNGGGFLFVAKNPTLRIRIVTGDTLTASIVLDRLPKDVQEVFLIGSSEVSRAIAIYLCRRNVRVLVCNH